MFFLWCDCNLNYIEKERTFFSSNGTNGKKGNRVTNRQTRRNRRTRRHRPRVHCRRRDYLIRLLDRPLRIRILIQAERSDSNRSHLLMGFL